MPDETVYQTQNNIDWNSIINNAIDDLPYYITLAQGSNGQPSASVAIGPRGATGSISPTLLLVGAGVIVALVLLLKK